jgi:hypothetical protein
MQSISGVPAVQSAMRLRSVSRPLAALLIAALVLGGLPGVAEAQDRPDLKVEEVKLFVKDGQVNDRVVSFRVTNVGKADATEATGKLEILSPPPAKDEGLKLGKIAKGASAEGFAQLPGPCDGHTVKVTLKAPNETNLGNNTVGPVKLCESKSPPKPPSAQSGGVVLAPSGDQLEAVEAKPEPVAHTRIGNELVLPEHKRPGPHDLSLQASTVRSWYRDRLLGDEEVQKECELVAGPGGTGVQVVWFQNEHEETVLGIVTSRCAYIAEAQVGVDFDYGILDDIQDMKITRAELIFDERELAWHVTGGTARQASGCVAAVGIATTELPPTGPFAAEPYRDVTPGASRQFDVRSAVQQQVWNERPRFGFVLRGSLSIDQLEGEGGSSCMSIIDNIRLEVHYVVEN